MTSATQKLTDLRDDLSRRFPEREYVIDGCLTAVLAREHVLLIGQPGTAKSALVRSIAVAFGGTYFERLLTKFSTPDELFGPISLRSLENDKFERVIEGKLPTVEFAFADEVFKSSSAILNTLLTLMNERLYHNDGPPILCPLVTLFGASNELPEGGELEALYDRFLVRFNVEYLRSNVSLRSIFVADDPVPTQFLTMDELRDAQAEVAKVKISNDTIDGLISIRNACNADGVIVSDRRWKRSLKAARARAYLHGRHETTPEDLYVLTDILWREPKEHSKIIRLVSDNADPVGEHVKEVWKAVDATFRELAKFTAMNVPSGRVAAETALKKYGEQRARLEELLLQGGARTRVEIEIAIKKLDGMIIAARRNVPAAAMPAKINILPPRRP